MSQHNATRREFHLLEFQKSVSEALVASTRTVSELASEDLDFYRSLDPQLAKRLDQQCRRVFALAEQLLNTAVGNTGASDQTGRRYARDSIDLSPEEGETSLDVVDGQWSKIVDVAERLFEKADSSLEEYKGVVRRGKTEADQVAMTVQNIPSQNPTPPMSRARLQNLTRLQNIVKPQLRFEDPPSNHATGIWKPVLTNKPHAIASLEDSTKLVNELDEAGQERQYHTHPYAEEIRSYTYPTSMYTKQPPIQPRDFENTTATWVSSPEALRSMIEELKTASEIAIDLEHHDYRTYTGITCLMQISTRSNDYIVDTLVPWRRKLQALNEVFADPSIIKVLHGSSMDIIWLQRDLGLYIVGLFDTYHASRALTYPQLGLAYLLRRFCNFQAQKAFQRADWRTRPLPPELFDYARSDTHFLLYILDRLRLELLERSTSENDLLQYVLEGSKQEALRRYELPQADPVTGEGKEGWMKLILQNSVVFSKEQFAVYKALHAWRDSVARAEDESIAYVLPNQSLFSLAKAMPFLPSLVFSALPLGAGAVVRNHVNEIVALINNARDEGTDGPELNDVLNERYALGKRKRGPQESSPKEDEPKKLKSQVEAQAEKLEQAKTKSLQMICESVRVEDVRMRLSTFWGSSFNEVHAQRQADVAQMQDVRLELPLPEGIHGSTETVNGDADQSHASLELAAQAQHAYIKAENRKLLESDDIFTVRQLGGKKRKSGTYSAEDDAAPLDAFGVDFGGLQQNDSGDDDGEASDQDLDTSPTQIDNSNGKAKTRRGRKRAERRAAAQAAAGAANGGLRTGHDPGKKSRSTKRAEKKAARAAAAATEHVAQNYTSLRDSAISAGSLDSQDDDGDEAPFDYAAAPSLLNTPSAGAGKRGGSGRKGKHQTKTASEAFNPYRKGNDAPKGLGKKQKAGAGRSATFAS